MLEQGILTPSEVRGIYRVNGLTKLPYQIVIAQELEGRERRLPRLERPRKYSGHIGDIGGNAELLRHKLGSLFQHFADD